MIGEALVFLKDHLNAVLKANSGDSGSLASGDKVVFVEGEQLESVMFPSGAISTLLINLEEERALRGPDPYGRTGANGTRARIQPDIRMNLYLLFVARFREYRQAWGQLSQIIEYFQSHRVFDRENAPALPPSIERLIMELVTLEFA